MGNDYDCHSAVSCLLTHCRWRPSQHLLRLHKGQMWPQSQHSAPLRLAKRLAKLGSPEKWAGRAEKAVENGSCVCPDLWETAGRPCRASHKTDDYICRSCPDHLCSEHGLWCLDRLFHCCHLFRAHDCPAETIAQPSSCRTGTEHLVWISQPWQPLRALCLSWTDRLLHLCLAVGELLDTCKTR